MLTPMKTALAILIALVLLPLFILAASILTSCAAKTDSSPEDVCFTHAAQEFETGYIACEPTSDTACWFDPQGTPIVRNGHDPKHPLSYVCTCTTGAIFRCWGSPGLAPAQAPQN